MCHSVCVWIRGQLCGMILSGLPERYLEHTEHLTGLVLTFRQQCLLVSNSWAEETGLEGLPVPPPALKKDVGAFFFFFFLNECSVWPYLTLVPH